VVWIGLKVASIIPKSYVYHGNEDAFPIAKWHFDLVLKKKGRTGKKASFLFCFSSGLDSP
jgi:hypothetical protein